MVIKRSLLLAVLAVVSAATPASLNRVEIGKFSEGNLAGWVSKSFVGETTYDIRQKDGKKALVAESYGSASGLGREITVDLTQTPYVNWSWRVDRGLPVLDETDKSGDDYAARLYVVKSGGALVWKTKALNYVWSGSQSRESSWPNAFKPKNSVMLAARGTEDSTGEWHHEKRNVREDFKRIFGKDITSIDAIAIMTDTDNSGLRANATYGDIYFTAN